MKKIGLLFGVIFFTASISVQAQNYKLHTLVIYSFTRYIHWPESYEPGDFEIKVLGDTPLTSELENMAKVKKVGDRPIKVTRINDVAELGRCHILVVPASQSSKLSEVLKKLDNESTLVVTEEPGLGSKGSDANILTRDDGKLSFELNQSSLNKRKLKVSTELTRLAILI